MKKLIGTMVIGLACFSLAWGGAVTNMVKPLVPWGDTWRDKAIETLDAYETEVNSLADGNFDGDVTVDGDVSIGDSATIGTNLTVGGVTDLATLNCDVDITATSTNDQVLITQTNAAGNADAPLVDIDDDRTGGTADTAGEASLVITAAGAYGLSVADGIVNVEGEIDCTGDMTLDPAGDDVIVDGTIDATAITVDAAAGIDVESAGELKIGAVTATSVTIGDAGTTVEIASSDWTISTAGVIANAVLSADQLTAASVASAIDGNAITNLDAANVEVGSTASAFDGSAITDLSAANITAAGTLPQLNGAALTALDAANITAATVATAIDINAATNFDIGNIAAGGTALAFDGQNITALDPANITGTGLVQADVWGAPGLTTVTNTTSETVVYVQTKTIAGGNLAERRFVRVYVANESGGAASDANMASLALTGGTAVDTVVANADYTYVVSSGGTCAVTATSSAPDAKWLTVIDGSSTTEQQIDFVGP